MKNGKRLNAVRLVCLAAMGVCAGGSLAMGADSAWRVLDDVPAAVKVGRSWVRPTMYRAFELDEAAMRAALRNAPLEGTPAAQAKPARIQIPLADGSVQTFAVVESPVMEPELQERYPDIRTYLATSEDEPGVSGRISMTPQGFRAAVTRAGGDSFYVDPYSAGEWKYLVAYNTKDLDRQTMFRCLTPGGVAMPFRPRDVQGSTDGTRRTYRMACSAAAEYTAFHSTGAPTVAQGLAAMTTALNRVNQIYENEATIRFVLVSRNDRIIYTNPATDPFTAPDNVPLTQQQNQLTLAAVIGSVNYDVGHILTAENAGGNAGAIGSVCTEGTKGLGYTSDGNPVGDPFTVRIWCHELGHQAGAYHTFNSCNGQQSGNRASEFEPGSGTTIMSYAGICADNENVQGGPDPMFNVGSFDFIWGYMTGGAGSVCPTLTPTVNSLPRVDAGVDRIIPRGTPFTLTPASFSDADASDVLTFSWEHMALGQAVIPGTDNSTSPILRVFAPTTNPSRQVPNRNLLLNPPAPPSPSGEVLPTLPRLMTWRCVVRDNKAGGGAVAYDTMTVDVTANAGPFRVTFPNAAGTLSGLQTVRWDVANSDRSPVNCSTVRIRLSTDRGLTFPTILADNLPNNGEAEIVLPSISTTQARIMVESIGNIFYDFSDVNFTIAPPTSGVLITRVGNAAITDDTGNGNRNLRADPGEKSVGIAVALRNGRGTDATAVTATLTSTTPGVTIRRNVVSYPDLVFAATTQPTQPWIVSLAPGMTCGSNINFNMSVSYRRGAGGPVQPPTNIAFTVPVGLPSGLGTPMMFDGASFDSPVTIPDNATPGLKLRIPVSGVGAVGLGVVGDLDFRINSQGACSSETNSPSAGIAHTYVGDLLMSLISPSSTSVLMMNRPGAGGTPSSGNNFCDTLLDDEAPSTSLIQNITTAGNPYSGTFRPVNPLSAFDDQPADGTWVFDIQDRVNGDSGTVRSVSIIIRPKLPPVCEAPITPQCPADLDDGSGVGIPDGAVTIEDVIFFVAGYEAGSVSVDIDDGSGLGIPDGAVTVEDILFFVERYNLGC